MEVFAKKALIWSWVSFFGGVVADAMGGWDASVKTLVIFMIIDFITAWMIAVIWHKSPNTETGTLSSGVCFKGLCKKMVVLFFIVIAARLDQIIGTDYIRDACAIGFIANELVSIIENAGEMGVPIPAVIVNMIDVLKSKEKKHE